MPNINPPIEILFEDEFILAVNKPAGLASQSSADKKHPDLMSVLQSQMKGPLFLHHRLDRDTSGLMLLVKNPKANAPMTEIFREHQIQKTYWALTRPPEEIISEDHWEVENHLIRRRKNFGSVKVFRTEQGGDFAHTRFQILKKSPDAFLIQAEPLTGRTHQIRVHCLNSGIPILGDSLYGGKDPRAPRLMLHAESLSFKHPIHQQKMQLKAPLPQDFADLLNNWALTPSFKKP